MLIYTNTWQYILIQRWAVMSTQKFAYMYIHILNSTQANFVQFFVISLGIYASAANTRWQRYYAFGSSVRPLSVHVHFSCPLTSVSHDALFNGGILMKIATKIRSCEWKLLERFPRSEVKGQDHMCTNV